MVGIGIGKVRNIEIKLADYAIGCLFILLPVKLRHIIES